jgi:hypothetical protein
MTTFIDTKNTNKNKIKVQKTKQKNSRKFEDSTKTILITGQAKNETK